MLKFSKANTKLRKLYKVKQLQYFLTNRRKIYSLDLLSGWSCVFADRCLSKVYETQDERRLKDGPRTEFRCFSASQEALLPAVYNRRKYNLDLLRNCKTTSNLATLIGASLPKDAGIIRIHVSGDFFNQSYLDAWLEVIEKNPDILFYAYTKAIPFWLKSKAKIDSLGNFIITASVGGKEDAKIFTNNLRFTQVVYSRSEAKKLKLSLDTDDSLAARPDKMNDSFALLIHGVQPKGSKLTIRGRAAA